MPSPATPNRYLASVLEGTERHGWEEPIERGDRDPHRGPRVGTRQGYPTPTAIDAAAVLPQPKRDQETIAAALTRGNSTD